MPVACWELVVCERALGRHRAASTAIAIIMTTRKIAPDFLGERLDTAGGLIDANEIETVKEIGDLSVGEKFSIVFAGGAIDSIGLVA